MDRSRTNTPTARRRPGGLPIRGFTLIELLVVVGIISVLMAILLPALSRARQEAYKVSCAGQQRQWGLALQGHANDNNNGLPDAWHSGWAGPYSHDIDPDSDWRGFMGEYLVDMDRSAAAAGEADIAYCPTTDHYRNSTHLVMGYFYLARQNLDQTPQYPDETRPWVSRARLDTNYARAPIMSDVYSRQGPDLTTIHPSSEQSTANHVNSAQIDTVLGSNFLFEDGHVQWYGDEEIDVGGTRLDREYHFLIDIPGFIALN